MPEKRLGLVGYPFSSGRSGARWLSVSKLREAGIRQRLAEGAVVWDYGDVEAAIPSPGKDEQAKVKNLPLVAEAVDRLAERVGLMDEFPVILGGDCTAIIGSARVLAKKYPHLATIYMDAHGDYNTPQTSPSGFIDGMCLAIAAGLGPETLVKNARLSSQHIILFGGRDFDAGETELIRSTKVNLVDLAKIRKEGVAAVAHTTLQVLGARPTLLHIDLDVLDPSPEQGLPAVDVPAAGGLTWDELWQATGIWAGEGRLVGLEVTGYNPLLDPERIWTGKILDLIYFIVGEFRG